MPDVLAKKIIEIVAAAKRVHDNYWLGTDRTGGNTDNDMLALKKALEIFKLDEITDEVSEEDAGGYRLVAARNERLMRENEELRKKLGWICCSERMPEAEQGVLVWGPNWRDWPIAVFRKKNEFNQADHWFTKVGDYHLDFVTYWMPIPTPPMCNS